MITSLWPLLCFLWVVFRMHSLNPIVVVHQLLASLGKNIKVWPPFTKPQPSLSLDPVGSTVAAERAGKSPDDIIAGFRHLRDVLNVKTNQLIRNAMASMYAQLKAEAVKASLVTRWYWCSSQRLIPIRGLTDLQSRSKFKDFTVWNGPKQIVTQAERPGCTSGRNWGSLVH